MYKRQGARPADFGQRGQDFQRGAALDRAEAADVVERPGDCLLYTSDAADERSSVDLGGRRIIKKKKQ